MIQQNDDLYQDYASIQQIAIIPAMLETVCLLTGLGFSAVARVTKDRWLACSVRDEVKFGLEEGNELQIETTICNEIRDSRLPVIIDHVDEDEVFRTHHTPKLYGLQSYISFPIILKNGTFFGTLCAIGTLPAKLSKPEITNTFKLFADLISFHLQSRDMMERSLFALQDTRDQNLQYKKITDHNLQEPLRKIRVYSDMLIHRTGEEDMAKAKTIAVKINSFSKELSSMIQHMTKLTELNEGDNQLVLVSLDACLAEACNQHAEEMRRAHIQVNAKDLPVVMAIHEFMQQFFSEFLSYMINFTDPAVHSSLQVSSRKITYSEIEQALPQGKDFEFCKLIIEQDRGSIDQEYITEMFDIFVHQSQPEVVERYSNGLAYCQKIIQYHGGSMLAEAVGESGLRFSIVLPLNLKK